MVFLQPCFCPEQYCFLLEQTVFNVLQKFKTYWVESSTQSSLVIQNYCFIDHSLLYQPCCTIVIYQLSSLTIIDSIIGVELCSPTVLVAMSANCRPPSHQSILCVLYFCHSLQNAFSLQCVLCVWYPYHYYLHIYQT